MKNSISLSEITQNVAKASGKAIKHASNIAGKTIKHTLIKLDQWQIPSSINWIFGLGFKIGLLLALKSFLILRYQGANLTIPGFIIVFSQLGLGVVLMACGMLMQDRELYQNPLSIRSVSRIYGFTGLVLSVIMALRVVFKWEYFRDPASVNWFVDFFTGIFKGAKEIGLSILFVDCDLWVAFCVLLFFVAYIYLNVKFMYQDSWCGRLAQRVPFLKSASLAITEVSEDKSQKE